MFDTVLRFIGCLILVLIGYSIGYNHGWQEGIEDLVERFFERHTKVTDEALKEEEEK